ncbi:MAG TPA: tetratricopeptide repeat protein [Gaiellaceae bacterium]|nr:tetratricopeptide repeat protein [Gaiellaceae bacterium]
MTQRTRMLLVAAVAVVAAAAVAGGAAVLSRDDEPETARPKGVPPVLIDVGVRTDPEAERLRRAAGLHAHGQVARARALFARGTSIQAQAGAALAAWPDGALTRLEALAREHPTSGAILFHLGLARFWSGDTDGAVEAWRQTRTRDPDSAFAVRAGDLLFRNAPPGLPTFVPSFRGPERVRVMEAPEQLAALRRMARRPDPRAKLLYGVALQRLDRPVSAQRQFSAAAKLAPRSPDALVADAIGRFDKQHPERAFSRMGPLTRRFPRAGTVRFHLGLMLLWLGDVNEAKRQLNRAIRLGPPHSREAKRLLDRLEDVQGR